MSDTHTERDSPSPAEEDDEKAKLDLSGLPVTFVVSTHMPPAILRSVEDALVRHGAPLTYDAKEARLFLCSLHTKRRVGVELRSVGVWTEELPEAEQLGHASGKRAAVASESSAAKRRKSQAAGTAAGSRREGQVLRALHLAVAEDGVLVAKHRWLTDSLARRRFAPLLPYTLYQGRRTHTIEAEGEPSAVLTSQPAADGTDAHEHKDAREHAEAILERARADTPPPTTSATTTRFISAPYGRRRFRDQAHGVRFPAAPAANRDRADSSSDETAAGSDATHDADADARDPAPGPVPDWVARKAQVRLPAPLAGALRQRGVRGAAAGRAARPRPHRRGGRRGRRLGGRGRRARAAGADPRRARGQEAARVRRQDGAAVARVPGHGDAGGGARGRGRGAGGGWRRRGEGSCGF